MKELRRSCGVLSMYVKKGEVEMLSVKTQGLYFSFAFSLL